VSLLTPEHDKPSLGHQEGIPQYIKVIRLTERDDKRKRPVSGNKKLPCNSPVKLGVDARQSKNHSVSQNHRKLGVGRDLCGSPSPTPLPKQGHPEQAAQDHGQAGLEYLQRRRLPSLPGQPGPGLRHPQREEVLPHLQLELPLLQFVPIAPCPVAGHHWKESGPVLLTPTLQIFIKSQGSDYGFVISPVKRCFKKVLNNC